MTLVPIQQVGQSFERRDSDFFTSLVPVRCQFGACCLQKGEFYPSSPLTKSPPISSCLYNYIPDRACISIFLTRAICNISCSKHENANTQIYNSNLDSTATIFKSPPKVAKTWLTLASFSAAMTPPLSLLRTLQRWVIPRRHHRPTARGTPEAGHRPRMGTSPCPNSRSSRSPRTTKNWPSPGSR